MKKINKARFKNSYFWMACAGVLYLILSDTGVISIDSGKFQQYLELISTIMIISGIWTDPTTPGLTDVVDTQEDSIQG